MKKIILVLLLSLLICTTCYAETERTWIQLPALPSADYTWRVSKSTVAIKKQEPIVTKSRLKLFAQTYKDFIKKTLPSISLGKDLTIKVYKLNNQRGVAYITHPEISKVNENLGTIGVVDYEVIPVGKNYVEKITLYIIE